MTSLSRRDFLRGSTIGLAALGTGGLLLRSDAQPTPASGQAPDGIAPPVSTVPTERTIEGPFFRASAPFRGKITPPLAPGVTLVVQGRVWSFATKKPIANAVLDIWQASAQGRYDNDDPRQRPMCSSTVRDW